jgi:hypothetical protein
MTNVQCPMKHKLRAQFYEAYGVYPGQAEVKTPSW